MLVYQLFPATVSTMASNVNKMYSLDQLWSMTSSNLRHILRENKQIVSGNKQILVARCYALNLVDDERESVSSEDCGDRSVDVTCSDGFDPFLQLDSVKEIGFNQLNLTAKGRQWETDLRSFPPMNFHQLYEYLVERTKSMKIVK